MRILSRDLGPVTGSHHTAPDNPRLKYAIRQKTEISKAPDPGTNSVPGSVTLEAALTLPLVLFFCGILFSFFLGQLWQIRTQRALDTVCEKITVWSYGLEFADRYTDADLMKLADAESGGLKGLKGSAFRVLIGEENWKEAARGFLAQQAAAFLWQELLKGVLAESIGRDLLERSPIRGGAQGLSLSGSTLADRKLDLVLRYRVESPVRFPFAVSYEVVQRSCRRLWVGTPQTMTADEADGEEDTVFVTAKGSVYHVSLGCRSLKIDPKAVPGDTLPYLRNDSGGRYYPCRYCVKRDPAAAVVYVTPSGDRYHNDRSCSRITRDVTKIALSEAQEKYRPCSFCADAS